MICVDYKVMVKIKNKEKNNGVPKLMMNGSTARLTDYISNSRQYLIYINIIS